MDLTEHKKVADLKRLNLVPMDLKPRVRKVQVTGKPPALRLTRGPYFEGDFYSVPDLTAALNRQGLSLLDIDTVEEGAA